MCSRAEPVLSSTIKRFNALASDASAAKAGQGSCGTQAEAGAGNDARRYVGQRRPGRVARQLRGLLRHVAARDYLRASQRERERPAARSRRWERAAPLDARTKGRARAAVARAPGDNSEDDVIICACVRRTCSGLLEGACCLVWGQPGVSLARGHGSRRAPRPCFSRVVAPRSNLGPRQAPPRGRGKRRLWEMRE